MSIASTTHDRAAAHSDRLALLAFWALIAISSFVLVEPAPFDLAFLGLFGLFLVAGLRIPKAALWLVLLFLGWLGFSLVGSVQGHEVQESLRHVGITALLCAVALFVACVINQFGERGLRVMMHGWTIAALAASLLGILGYFGLLGGLSDHFLLYGRAKGTFKDPNVLAPYLVVPALYCIHECISRRGFAVLVNFGYLAVIMLALLLSFSRGGWAHFALSGFIAGSFWLAATRDERFKLRLVVFSVFGVVIGAAVLVFLLNIESIGHLFEIRAQLTQDYDSAGSGRFAGQWETVLKIIDTPLGRGAQGFLPDWFEQPHNVYLFMFMIGGWGGGLFYLALVVLTMAHGLRALNAPSAHNGLTIILVATFIGLVLEGLIVDTDHWRHFFMITGALWGLSFLAQRQIGAPEADRPQIAQPSMHGTG